MIEAPNTLSWKKDFARSAEYRREQARFFKEVERKADRKQANDQTEDTVEAATSMVMLAAEADLIEFDAELDDYRTVTVEALIENERQRTAVQAEIDELLAKAYVLEDGRRVFKTRDGLRVFDEHGVELSAEEIDPELIEEWRPVQESYAERRDFQQQLIDEHEQLLTFEGKVEEAMEQRRSGKMTVNDLEDLRDDLNDCAPEAVLSRMDGYEPTEPVSMKSDFGKATSFVPVYANPAQAFDQFTPD